MLLCSRSENVKFLSLGSGLQCKCGELTMSRNDPTRSVPEAESLRFKNEVLALIGGLHAAEQLSVHDTGTDLEIAPCSAGSSFSKGQGTHRLDEALGLDL